GAYRPAIQAGGFLYISGQIPIENGAVRYKGLVGAELTLEEGRAAAALTALNALAQIRHFLGGFERLRQIVRLEGHVASAPGFYDQPKVLDAASELYARVLGEHAGHVRTAFSSTQLPANAAVQLVVIAETESAQYA
ncbi:MAG: RidA family protein, partial [Burkholderiales bacterium]